MFAEARTSLQQTGGDTVQSLSELLGVAPHQYFPQEAQERLLQRIDPHHLIQHRIFSATRRQRLAADTTNPEGWAARLHTLARDGRDPASDEQQLDWSPLLTAALLARQGTAARIVTQHGVSPQLLRQAQTLLHSRGLRHVRQLRLYDGATQDEESLCPRDGKAHWPSFVKTIRSRPSPVS